MDIWQIYSAVSTVAAVSFAYLWYRREEVVKLATDVYNAAKDKNVTEDEFQLVADDLGKVIFKKVPETTTTQ